MKFNLTTVLEAFNNLNDQTRYAIFGAVVFLILLLDFFFLVSLQTGSIASANDQIKKLNEDTQQVFVDKARINQLRKNLQKERLHLKSLSDKVRPIQEVPSILGTISSDANDNGVKIDQLVPDKTRQEALVASVDGSRYIALPIMIKAHCGYHMFGRFLSSLENENMFFIVKDFIIQNNASEVHAHLFSLTIKMVLVDRSPLPSSKKL